jgi:hypothetical protein
MTAVLIQAFQALPAPASWVTRLRFALGAGQVVGRGVRMLVLCSVLHPLAAAHAQPDPSTPTPRAEVTDLRVLLIQALDSPLGRAQGKLVGEWAQAITQKFSSSTHQAGDILVDVHTLQRYAQPGCSRLNIRLAQDGVLLPGTKAPRLQTMDIGLNYCRDGLPPKSLAVAPSSNRQ